MKIFIKLISAVLLLSMMLIPLSSCGGTEEELTDTEAVTTTDPEESYQYFPEGVDFGGKEYHILNCEREQWEYIAMFTSHEYLGQAINDAFYSRTAWIEDTLNCKLVENNIPMDQVMPELDSKLNAGEDLYAGAFVQVGGIYGNAMTKVLQGQLYELDSVEAMHLDENYYVKYMMDAMSVGKKHYTAASSNQLAYFEGSWHIFFDVGILTDAQVDLPYDYVRNGTWTLETMAQMARQVMTTGEAGNYDFDPYGSAKYGITGGIDALFYGIGGIYATKDAEDFPMLNVETTGFVDRVQAIAAIVAEEGLYLDNDYTNPDKHTNKLLTNRRVAFTSGEIFQLKLTIEAGVDVGIVPLPKYNEDQERYMPFANINGNYFVIPITNSKPEEIGLIYDAMAWEADKTFEKVYYVDHLELKMNSGEMEDDVEMLQIIRESMSGNAGLLSGTVADLKKAVNGSMLNGGHTVASDIATSKKSVNALLTAIKATLDK